MKTKKIILVALTLVVLTSCQSTYFFQVYKATPTEKITTKDNFLIYDDENCKVSYNLWEEGGEIGFVFLNKTDKNIYLNLEESFFILNGISYNYYKNRVFTNSSSRASSASTTGVYYSVPQTNTVGVQAQAGYSVSYNEEKVVCIPAHTSKIITEYNINETLYRDCDLFKYPTKKQVKAKTFTKANSPIVFSNRIAYKVGQEGNLIKFENEFYVSEVTNYPKTELIEKKYDEFCNQKSYSMYEYFRFVSPDRFYIKYAKGTDSWKH